MTEFAGTVGRTLADSEPHFVEPVHPGEDAPNVVLILLDDTAETAHPEVDGLASIRNVHEQVTQARRLECSNVFLCW